MACRCEQAALLEFLTELYPHAVLFGYLAAKVALLVLREPVGVLASGEVVVHDVHVFDVTATDALLYRDGH